MARTIKTTVYDVHELGERAKEKAREWYIYDVLSSSGIWYDQVFDDFEETCAILGITVLKRTQTCRINNRDITRSQRCIWFSGFASQGDGACFEGDWRHAPAASRRIREHAPQDKKLHAIADALTKVQKRNFYQLGAVMTHQGPGLLHARILHERGTRTGQRARPGADRRLTRHRDQNDARTRTVAVPQPRSRVDQRDGRQHRRRPDTRERMGIHGQRDTLLGLKAATAPLRSRQ